MNFRVLLMCAMLGTLFTACKKDLFTKNSSTSPVPSPVTPAFGSGIDGGLVSVRVGFSYDPNKFAKFPITMPVVDLEAESATAVFGNLAAGSFVNAGTVSVNSNGLEKFSNNSYVKTAFDYTSGSFTLGFDGGSNWSVGGSGDVAAFTYNHNQSFPTYSGRASMPETASTSSTLTVSLSGISNADSVYVVLAGNGKQNIKHIGPPYPSSITFSASEVAAIGATGGKPTGLLEVCPFRVKLETINAKQYAFIKEYAAVKNLTIN